MKASLSFDWYDLNNLRWAVLHEIKSYARLFAQDHKSKPEMAELWQDAIQSRGTIYRQILHAQTRLLERMHA